MINWANKAIQKNDNLFSALVCLLVATINWLCLAQNRYQLGSIDPYLYTSLSLDYDELLGRFGPTYYATRVAVIAPMSAFYHLFGLEHGYILLRILFSAFAGYSFFLILRLILSHKPALYLSCFLIISPWLTGQLSWDYVYGFSAVYFLGGIAFLMQPKGRIFSISAGFFSALAVNSCFTALPWVGVFFLAWFVGNFNKQKLATLKKMSTYFLGTFLFYLPVSLIMWIKYPVWGKFFEWRSVEVALWLMKGAAKNWHVPFNKYLESGDSYILLPFFVLMLLAILFPSLNKIKAHNLFIVCLSYLFFSCVLVFYFHNITRMAVFINYCYVFLLPPTYLGLSSIMGATNFNTLNWQKPTPWLILGLILIAFHSENNWMPPLQKVGLTPQILFLGILFFGLILLFWKITFLSLSIFLFGFTALPLGGSSYKNLYGGDFQINETAAIKISKEVGNAIKNHAPYKDGPMRLWVPIPESPPILCITAMNFWGYSMIYLADKKGLPDVSIDVADKNLQGVRYLILVSDVGQGLIEQGLNNVFQATGETWVLKYGGQYKHGPFVIDMTIAEKKLP